MKLPGDDAGVLALLRSPPPPWRQGTLLVQELIQARREGLLVRAFKQGQLDPRWLEGEGHGLLHAAAATDTVELLRALVVDKGVSPNLRDAKGYTALAAAVDNRMNEAALFLLDVPGIEVNTRLDSSGTTPLMLAAKRGMLEVVTRLVAKDADVDLRDKHRTTALGYAVDER